MRVTDAMVAEVSRRGVADARAAALKASRVASTGIRVELPGDDASAASAGRRLSSEASRFGATMAAADEGSRGLDIVDATLAQMGDLLSEARVLAVQGANDTLGPSERGALADQVAGLRSALLQTASTRIDNRYVLNGMREDVPPYDAAGTFIGDRNLREVEASPGHLVPTGLAIGDVLSPTTGGDTLADLAALEAALRAGDTTQIRAGIDAMAAGTDRVAEARSDVGNRMNTFDMAYALGERLETRLREDRAKEIEADPFDALSDFESARTALEQAVSIAARLPLPGLVQSMR